MTETGETAAGGLERRYRRLLAWYPAGHRAAHEEEMIGVLLAAARPGQRRPGLATAADLVAGALRIRARTLLAGARDPRWDDALAVASILAPLLMLGAGLVDTDVIGIALRGVLRGHWETPFWLAYPWIWPLTAGPVILAGCAFAGLRRVTALAALLITGSSVIFLMTASASYWYSPGRALWIFLGLLATAAPLLSAGPRRGRQILRWWGAAAAGVAVVLLAQLSRGNEFQVPLPALPAMLVIVGGAGAVTAGVCLVTPVGRRVLALLAIPALPYAVILLRMTVGLWGWGGGLARTMAVATVGAVLYLPPLVLAGAIVFAWTRPRGSGPDQAAKR